jgi:glycerol-3-phosphate O-acyltransferase
VSVEYEDRDALERMTRDSLLVYLMNHRSNADYVLVSYALAGHVAISYAVGEWARAFPLEYVFKAFGAYFVRRRFREALYHTVLESYVQLITRRGVTQGIFLEGGLTRDGLLRPPKLGLLDYVIGIGRDPVYRPLMYVVPVAVNYDRVLEDRSLLAELLSTQGRARPSRLSQLREVSRYVGWNLGRIATGRWKRYGRAAVTIGRPVPLAPWFARETTLFEVPRAERLPRVQALCDEIMRAIGVLIPVTPVPLACAAIQSFERDFISRKGLLQRMEEMRDVLVELNARVLRADRSVEETFSRAWRMLRMRRILVEDGDGFAVMPGNRPLISYYANSVAHLLGPFERAVRERDALPMDQLRESREVATPGTAPPAV